MARFLPFQNGKNTLFTVETVAQRNGTVPTEQALSGLEDGDIGPHGYGYVVRTELSIVPRPGSECREENHDKA